MGSISHLTISHFVEAVAGVTVRGEDCDFVAEALEADCGVYH